MKHATAVSKAAGVAFALAALGACAQTYHPIVDMKDVDPANYQQDLAECRQYAEQANPAGEAVAGALLAAGLGAALGAITGSFDGAVSVATGAAAGAALGSTVGAASGGAHGVKRQIAVIDNCLRGRGYSVLG